MSVFVYIQEKLYCKIRFSCVGLRSVLYRYFSVRQSVYNGLRATSMYDRVYTITNTKYYNKIIEKITINNQLVCVTKRNYNVRLFLSCKQQHNDVAGTLYVYRQCWCLALVWCITDSFYVVDYIPLPQHGNYDFKHLLCVSALINACLLLGCVVHTILNIPHNTARCVVIWAF